MPTGTAHRRRCRRPQDWMTKNGEQTVAAEVHRLVGDLLAMSGRSDAEPHFLRALEVARAQKARLFELRAASSLARLWRDQGRREEARTTLEPVYGWFTEGFDMPDLVDARLLLESLKSPRSRGDCPGWGGRPYGNAP